MSTWAKLSQAYLLHCSDMIPSSPRTVASLPVPHPITPYPNTFQSPLCSSVAVLHNHICVNACFPKHSHVCDATHGSYTCTPCVRTSFVSLRFLQYVLCYLSTRNFRPWCVLAFIFHFSHPVTSTAVHHRRLRFTCVYICEFLYIKSFKSVYCGSAPIIFMSTSFWL